MTNIGVVIRRRLLGLAFIIVLAGCVALSVAIYLKTFSDVLLVTLQTDHTGLQLNKLADVKVRGALVGEVRDITSDGEDATLHLALDPKMVGYVPSNVSARILPKTLFGEKYVALIPPEHPSARPIQAGEVISEDRSSTAIELEQALNDIIPLLKAVKPEKLAATLAAMARGLEGRGDRLGRNLVELGDYLAELNKEMPTIREDIRRLGNVLDVYDQALPDLVDLLRNLTVTSTTISDQRNQLRSMLVATADVGDQTRYFLDEYGARIIQLGDVSLPVTHLLARYSPEFPCTFNGLVTAEKLAAKTFDNGRLNAVIEIVPYQGKYRKGVDEPAHNVDWGPRCWGMPNPQVPLPPLEPDGTGYDFGRPREPVGLPGGLLGRSVDDSMLIDPTMGYAGTDDEKTVIKPIVAAATDTPVTEVGDLAVLLWGPLMRGAKVNVE
jgi:phospholipid/cholesterol/gamma-HCH transport system substrate-binding protein